MKIIYSPEFNSTSYINLEQRQGQLLGLKVCGSAELLSELFQTAAIEQTFLDPRDRKARCCTCRKKANRDRTPDTVDHMHRHSADRVVHMRHVIIEPDTEDHEKSGDAADDRRTRTVRHIAGSRDGNESCQGSI